MSGTERTQKASVARRDDADATLAALKTVATGIGAMFGPDCEVAVHDLRRPTESLIHLVNGHISGRKLGSPIRDLISAVLPNLDESNVLAGYPTPLADGRVLKSTTCLVRDAAGEPLFALCINFDTSNFVAAADAMERFTRVYEAGGKPRASDPDLGDAEILDVLRVLVRNTAAQFKKSPRDLTKSERLEAVAFLESKGAFLIKGSVPLVAETLALSEPSIYRYIDEVRERKAAEEATP